jgi:hypothetical protein
MPSRHQQKNLEFRKMANSVNKSELASDMSQLSQNILKQICQYLGIHVRTRDFKSDMIENIMDFPKHRIMEAIDWVNRHGHQ